MKAYFDIPKVPRGMVNVSVVRDDGARLSFAADDSCGALPSHGRTYLQAFDRDGQDQSEEILSVSPEVYLRELAAFLGYELVERVD